MFYRLLSMWFMYSITTRPCNLFFFYKLLLCLLFTIVIPLNLISPIVVITQVMSATCEFYLRNNKNLHRTTFNKTTRRTRSFKKQKIFIKMQKKIKERLHHPNYNSLLVGVRYLFANSLKNINKRIE